MMMLIMVVEVLLPLLRVLGIQSLKYGMIGIVRKMLLIILIHIRWMLMRLGFLQRMVITIRGGSSTPTMGRNTMKLGN